MEDSKSSENKNLADTKKTPETHQQAGGNTPVMTTAQGIPIADGQNSLHPSPCGPTLLEDFIYREKIFHFDHERVPERVVHARGFGAHGYLEILEPIPQYTKADIFQRTGRTPAFVRFSTALGSKGSPDLARDVRGFAVKIYTRKGNWDIVGNNIPVFFVQEAIKFPDIIHAGKEEPDSGFPQAQTAHDSFWDFISLNPESLHITMWAMSDRGIPRSFRFMEGFGVHTFRLVNAKNEYTFVKFHWKPRLGLQSVTWSEAQRLNGADPDFHRRDLWNAIKTGNYPEWDLGLQIFSEETAKTFDFDVLDATKLIPEELVPVRRVGRLVLDRCVDNFFAETEQVAFCTANIVPGIDFTDDPLLQGRNFSYLDTQLSRLGSPNFTQLPINAPKCPVRHFQQDGRMAFYNIIGPANYEPNSLGDKGGPRESPEEGFVSYPAKATGPKMRVRPSSFSDHYSQATLFYNSQTDIEQRHIQSAFTFELSKVTSPAIQMRVISHLLNINEDLAKNIAHNLGVRELPKPAPMLVPKKEGIKESPALSIIKNGPVTFKGRRLGLLVSENSDFSLIDGIDTRMKMEEAELVVIAPKIQGLRTESSGWRKPSQCLQSTLAAWYDAVALLLSTADLKKMDGPALVSFVQDSYYNYKFIAFSGDVAPLMERLGIQKDDGMVEIRDNCDWDTFITKCRKLRYWQRKI
uniref:Catalase n=1 Tax=Antonospora locustae TaxID=278021 RepID=Q6VUC4_ANTLO|nr:group II large subunit catalase [Antonospora locustae]